MAQAGAYPHPKADLAIASALPGHSEVSGPDELALTGSLAAALQIQAFGVARPRCSWHRRDRPAPWLSIAIDLHLHRSPRRESLTVYRRR